MDSCLTPGERGRECGRGREREPWTSNFAYLDGNSHLTLTGILDI